MANTEIPDNSFDTDETQSASASPRRRRRLTGGADASQVTPPVRVAAAWSWRIVVIVAAVATVVFLLRPLSMLIIAFLVAVLFAALLAPVVNFLRTKWRMGPTRAATAGLVASLLIVTAAFTLAMTQVIRQFPLIIDQTIKGMSWLLDWFARGPIGPEKQVAQDWLNDIQGSVSELMSKYGTTIATGALTFASKTVALAAGVIIMLFTLFFLMRDGRSMWVVFVRSLPEDWREPVDEAAIRGWITLGEYVRTQAKVAAIDALGIGIGAMILKVPLAIPIMVLVFLFAFVPILGAFISGGIAVLIALVNNGLQAGILMLLIVLLVQQIESNVLHPWLMANAVSLHPVAVLFAVTAGGMVAGIAGAIFAVPMLAFLNVALLYLHGRDPYPGLADAQDRPGGPPGSLSQQIDDSYPNKSKGSGNPNKIAQKVRSKAQARAEQKGHVLASSNADQPEVDVVWDQPQVGED